MMGTAVLFAAVKKAGYGAAPIEQIAWRNWLSVRRRAWAADLDRS